MGDRLTSERGFTLTELIIASGAFVVILTSAMAMLVQWQRLTGRSEADIVAINQGTRAMSQIMDDVRSSTYVLQYAMIILNFNSADFSGDPYNMPAVDQATTMGIPIVSQAASLDAAPATLPGGVPASVGSNELEGINSTGSLNVLALISDQPSGITLPRYIFYWVGAPKRSILANTISVSSASLRLFGSLTRLNVCPLYRLEASPSATGSFMPRCMYAYTDSISTQQATSCISINVRLSGSTSQLYYNAAQTTPVVSMNCRLTKIADIVTDPSGQKSVVSFPFTLRNPHPYSNKSLISPYVATVSIRVSRAFGGARPAKTDVYELNSSGYARNVPLPQNPNP